MKSGGVANELEKQFVCHLGRSRSTPKRMDTISIICHSALLFRLG